MKAWEISAFGIDGLRMADQPDPTPGAGQVVVRTRAVSLNYRDLMMVNGWYNPKLAIPCVPCSDGAGEIVAVGAGVTRFKPGDRVAGTFFQSWDDGPISDEKRRHTLGDGQEGMLSEYVLLSERGVIAVPAHLTYEDAATLPCAALTAWNALFETGGLRPGQTVFTLGTGGVSLFAVQFATLAGARAIISSSRDEKLARALALGASDGINYKTEPDWDKRAVALTNGVGVDQIIELGGAGTLPKSFKAVRTGGTISLIGVLAGANSEVNPIGVLMRSIRLQGIFVGSRGMFENMNKAIDQHKIKPVIDRVFPFADAAAALRHMEAGAHFGKVVIGVG